MNPTTRTRYPAAALAGLVGILIVLLATSRYGVGTPPDGVAYLSVARNLLSGQGYTSFDGSAYVHWPPLFPTLLAAIGLGGIDPLESARYFNAVAFGLTAFVACLLFFENIKSRPLVLLGIGSVLISRALIVESMFAQTEPLFSLFILLSLLSISRYLQSNRFSLLLLSAVLAALACLTKYIGVAVILTAVLLILSKRGVRTTTKLVNAAVYGLISVFPMIIWIVRNYLVSSTIGGERGPSTFTFLQNVYLTLDTLSVWILPLKAPLTARVIVTAMVVLVLVGITFAMIRKRESSHQSNGWQITSIWLFVLIYLGFLITSATFSNSDINERLLSGIYVPLILMMLLVADNALSLPITRLSKQRLSLVLVVGLSLWFAYSLARIGKVGLDALRSGSGGYSTVAWHNSEVIHYIQEHALRGQIYSNMPDGIYILTGIRAKFSPTKYLYNAPTTMTGELLKFKESVATNPETYLVWFEGKPENEFRAYLHDIQELRSAFDTEVVAVGQDGAIYRVKR